MSERITLMDVMLGIDKHGLICKLTEESFTFLIGIILEHNRRGFKAPFDLNNLQAMAAGGGNTPKSVRRRRDTLCKFRIDGKPLLKVVSGNYGRNTCAKYEINYESLLVYNGVWTKQNNLPAHKWVGKGRVEGNSAANPPPNPPINGSVPGPILRSEERREDHTHPTVNLVTTGEGAENSSEVGGGDFVLTEEKSEEDFKKAQAELGYYQVNEPARSELAAKYQTRYLLRQMAQIKRDHTKGIVFDNPGGALVARIKSGHVTEDYPE